MIEVHQFPCLSDNYGFLVHSLTTHETVAIDTPDGREYLKQAYDKGWQITAIWNTHWHPDHTDGNAVIKAETGCMIFGPINEKDNIPQIDRPLSGKDSFQFGDHTVQVIDVPGHTLGHIAYYLPESGIAFVGDALFALGCGRVFEGDMPMMWQSLSKLKALPDDTVIYCAHEYTSANAQFAQTVEPENTDLLTYISEIREKRARNLPTVPTTIGKEKATNPFLRADLAHLQAKYGFPDDAASTFGAIRAAKDSF